MEIVRSARFVVAVGLACAACLGPAACFVSIDESKIKAGGGGSTESDGALADGSAPADLDEAGTPIEAGADGGEVGNPELAAALLGAWTFDDGTAADSSGKGRAGVLVGSPSFSAGARGQAVTLAPGQAFEVPSLSNAAFPKSGALSFWFLPLGAGGTIPLFDDHQPGRGHLNVSFVGTLDAGTLQVESQPGSIYMTYTYKAESFVHAVITWSALRVTLYLGSQRTQLRQCGTDDVPTALDVSGQAVRFAGGTVPVRVDEVRLYQGALSEGAIGAIP